MKRKVTSNRVALVNADIRLFNVLLSEIRDELRSYQGSYPNVKALDAFAKKCDARLSVKIVGISLLLASQMSNAYFAITLGTVEDDILTRISSRSITALSLAEVRHTLTLLHALECARDEMKKLVGLDHSYSPALERVETELVGAYSAIMWYV